MKVYNIFSANLRKAIKRVDVVNLLIGRYGVNMLVS